MRQATTKRKESQQQIRVFLVDIRSETWDDSKSGWDGCRIEFSIEW